MFHQHSLLRPKALATKVSCRICFEGKEYPRGHRKDFTPIREVETIPALLLPTAIFTPERTENTERDPTKKD